MSQLFSPVRAQHQFLQNYLKFQIALFQLKGHGNFFKEHQRSECLSSFFGAPGAYTFCTHNIQTVAHQLSTIIPPLVARTAPKELANVAAGSKIGKVYHPTES